MQAKRALGSLSTGSKDYGTHNTPHFPQLKVCAFSVGENMVFLNLECGKLKGLGELMRTLNAS